MSFKHVIPTTGYRALFSRLAEDEEENDLPVNPDDCLIFPVLAFAVRDDPQGNQQICGLILDDDGLPAVCEDAKFATFLFYVPPADAPHVTRTVEELLQYPMCNDEERWTLRK